MADTDYFKRAMQGTPHVGAPLVDPQSQHPFVVLAVPVRDSLGRVGGVLGGIINLQQPKLPSPWTERCFGLTGHTFVITLETAPSSPLQTRAGDGGAACAWRA